MAYSGSFPNAKRDFFMPGATADADLNALVQAGLVEKSKPDFFHLSHKGQALLCPATRLTRRSNIGQYSRDVPLEKMTEVELILQLTEKGWKEQVRVRGNDAAPYKQGGKKHWIRLHNKKPSKNYMRVLLGSENLFKKGLKAIYHHQLEAQLSKMFFGLCNVQ